ncbi:MAG: aldehyde dehydrogenase family protein, partial [Acidimicrobiales bacterium]
MEATMYEIQHLIDGQAAGSTSGNVGPVFDPATGEQIAQVGLASVAEVDAAVASARSASTEWGEVSLARRTKLMLEFRNLVVDNAEEVAKRLTAEHGKVLDDARGEVARGIENIEFACGLADALKGMHSEQASSGVDVYTVRRPLGVVAG